MRLLGFKCIVALLALYGIGPTAAVCEQIAEIQMRADIDDVSTPAPFENDPPPVPDFRPLRGNSPDQAKIRYGDAVIAWSRRHRRDRLTPQQQEGELSSEESTLMKAREIVALVRDDEGDRLGQAQRKRRTEAQNKVYKAVLKDLLTYGGVDPDTIKSLKYTLIRVAIEPTVIDGDSNRFAREQILQQLNAELTDIANQRIAYHNEIVDFRTPLIKEYNVVAKQASDRWQAHLDFVAKREQAEHVHDMFQQMYDNMFLQMGVGTSDQRDGSTVGTPPNSIAVDLSSVNHDRGVPPYLQPNQFPNPGSASPSHQLELLRP